MAAEGLEALFSCVMPCSGTDSYLLLPQFTPVRGMISREQRKEVNQTCIA